MEETKQAPKRIYEPKRANDRRFLSKNDLVMRPLTPRGKGKVKLASRAQNLAILKIQALVRGVLTRRRVLIFRH